MGEYLRNNPDALKNIGNMIRDFICKGTAPPYKVPERYGESAHRAFKRCLIRVASMDRFSRTLFDWLLSFSSNRHKVDLSGSIATGLCVATVFWTADAMSKDVGIHDFALLYIYFRPLDLMF